MSVNRGFNREIENFDDTQNQQNQKPRIKSGAAQKTGPNPVQRFAINESPADNYDHDDDENNHPEAAHDCLKKRVAQIVIDVIVIVIIFACFIGVYFGVSPKIRYFTCDESDVFYPLKPDTIPFYAVGLYGTIGPILFILAVEIINSKLFSKNSPQSTKERVRIYLICVFHAISLFILGIGITLLLTEIGKRWIGRLRPHFMSVCQPAIRTLSCTTSAFTGFVYNPIDTGGYFCAGNPSDVVEARLSFPSGHSSYSCYCMLFLIIYLEARLQLLKLRFIKPLLQTTAFIAAYVTCISRIADYHHRGSDVIGGAVLGSAIALLITLVIGRVLWDYHVKSECSEIDLKRRRQKKMSKSPYDGSRR
jgi:phosphatidate phosphatase